MTVQTAQGGDRRMAQASRQDARHNGYGEGALPSSEAVRAQATRPKMGADLETLIANGNLKVNQDGTVDFSAVSKNANSEIKFSIKKFGGDNSELIALDRDKEVGQFKDKNGFQIVADTSVKNPNLRNIFLTLGRDVERFTVEIDGKIYIIDRKDIQEYSEGERKAHVVQYSEQPDTGRNIPINRMPVAKYRELENLTLSPNGEVQFLVESRVHSRGLCHLSDIVSPATPQLTQQFLLLSVPRPFDPYR